MVDAISQKVVSEIGGLAQQSAERSSVSPKDAVDFSAKVNGSGETGQLEHVAPREPVAEMNTAVQNPQESNNASMGDRILSHMEDASKDMQDARQKFVDTVGGGKMAEMYKLQLDVAQLTTAQTVMGQAGSKTSQGVQTLLKGQ